MRPLRHLEMTALGNNVSNAEDFVESQSLSFQRKQQCGTVLSHLAGGRVLGLGTT